MLMSRPSTIKKGEAAFIGRIHREYVCFTKSARNKQDPWSVETLDIFVEAVLFRN